MIVITGGCGFLGRALALRIARRGDRVLILDDRSTPGSHCPDHPLIRWHPLNLAGEDCDQYAIAARLVSLAEVWRPTWGAFQVKEIWHLASPASPPLYKARPLDTLRLGGHTLDQLARLAYEWGATLIYASSSEVYGQPRTLPTPETEPVGAHCQGPRSMYDMAKAYGEALCYAWKQEKGLDARVVRIFNTYGPGMSRADGRLVSSLLGAALDGTPFRMDGGGGQGRTLSYLDDTIEGLLHVATHWPHVEPVNVGGVHHIRVCELVTLVEKLLGVPVRLQHAPRQDEHDPRDRVPDLSRLRLLGWEPRVSLEEGLSRTAAWLRDNK